MKTSKRLGQASVLLVPLIGGILMGLTPAPVEAWFLAWIALVPLWFVVAQSQSIRQCALYGLVWGIGYHGLALFWITGVHPMTWMGVPWLASLAIAFFCWAFITLWGAVLVAIWAALLLKINQRKLPILIRILIGTALWCGLEALWSSGALWWTSLSYTQSPHNLPILHLARVSGPTTVTALIVTINGLISEAGLKVGGLESWQVGKLASWQVSKLASLKQPSNLQTSKPSNLQTFNPSNLQPLKPSTLVSIAIALFVISHLIGFGLYNRPLTQSSETALNVGIIQGNIGNDRKLFTDGKRLALERYTNGYEKLANEGVDAVLTPEGAFPFFLTDLKRQYFYSAILDKGVVAWVGAYGEKGRSYTNSLFTLTNTGETFSRYDKAKLVPFGEYIPFEPILGKIINRLSPLDAHLAAGSPNQLFDTPFGRAIVGICYESTFAEHFRRQAAQGGQFILTASNNAHYSETMPAQHHAQDVMRSIETDRWAVRATNTGYSGIVDPHGKTRWISGINTYEIHADTIYRRQTQTLYVRWGDWLMPVLLGLGTISWFAFNRR